MSPLRSYRAGRCNYMYLCFVRADGTFDVGPDGWTATKKSAGVYEVVHDLGDLNYLPLPIPANGVDYKTQAAIQERTENAFTVAMYSSTQAADTDFGVLVITTQ